ncbi:MAG: hypothetical protein ACK4IX_05695 [Candidatus Sericytochromatia bacterium]
MIKKAILFKNPSFELISFLSTGYWLGEEYLTYYDDIDKPAQGDLVGKLILLEHCKSLILEELYKGIYNTEFMLVEIKQSDFNRKYDTSSFHNWVGWTTKHKKYELIKPEIYNWVLKV